MAVTVPAHLAPRALLPSIRSVVTPVGALRLHAAHARPAHPVVALPVVLVHGYVISGRYMRPTLRRVAREADCWAPDLPGHGRSSTPPAVLDVAGYADALAAWMEAVGLARAVLVGNSLGCQIVARAAVRHPARVAGLVLAGPTVDARARSIGAQLWRLSRDALRERPSLWFLELADLLRVGPRRALAMARMTVADRIEGALPEVRCPVRVVRGELDPLVSQPWAVRIAAAAGAPPPIVIRGAAHGVNYDAPEALARIVLDFARELR
jgi:pimeloyl-ACP methyl ester carboxylesterase